MEPEDAQGGYSHERISRLFFRHRYHRQGGEGSGKRHIPWYLRFSPWGISGIGILRQNRTSPRKTIMLPLRWTVYGNTVHREGALFIWDGVRFMLQERRRFVPASPSCRLGRPYRRGRRFRHDRPCRRPSGPDYFPNRRWW